MKTLPSETVSTTAADREVSGEVIRIRGGRPLTGRVEVKGAKNLATKAMEARSAMVVTPAGIEKFSASGLSGGHEMRVVMPLSNNTPSIVV